MTPNSRVYLVFSPPVQSASNLCGASLTPDPFFWGKEQVRHDLYTGSLPYNEALSMVRFQMGKDNHVWCLDACRTILDYFPTGEEVLEIYTYLRGKLAHLETTLAYYRLGKWRGDALLRSQAVPRGAFSIRYQVLRSHVERYLVDTTPDSELRRGATLVEVAFGTGDIPCAWAEMQGVERVVALDMSDAHLYLANTHFRNQKVTHVAAMADTLPLRGNSADIVVLAGLLEHVPDPELVLREAERIAVDGALICINTPEGGMDWYNPEARARTYFDHVRTFDLPRLLGGKKSPALHYQPYGPETPVEGPTLAPPPWAVWDGMGEWMGSYIVEKGV